MFIQENIQLQSLNTMATPALARWFCVVQTEQEVLQALNFCRQQQCNFLVIGEGSNTLFTDNVNKLIIANRIGAAGQIRDLFASSAIEIIAENQDNIDLKIGAGVNWHQLVEQSISQGYVGLEQLALIPGLVGAAPIQNIGAYGVEIKELLRSVTAVDVATNEVIELDNQACEFSYRDSIFKRKPQDYIITHVILRLSKQQKNYVVDQLYPALQQLLSDQEQITSQQLFNTVCQVRQSKLPNPEQIPNSGSFFKNPVISRQRQQQLLEKFPDLVHFPSGNSVKLAAGWLIEHVGLKGQYQENGIGCYEKQALVIINAQRRSGKDVLKYAEHIQQAVKEQFGVTLEPEPRIY